MQANEFLSAPPYLLDLRAERLTRSGEPVALPPKAFRVLRYLAEHAGRLVTRNELLDEVWRGVHVGDAVLKVCIADIRKALNDSSTQPRYIETHHGRGYRFIHEVEGIGRNPHATGQTLTPATCYTHNGDVSIAYQVLGSGPVDLVFVMGWVSNIEYFWIEPLFARFLHRLASFSRLIVFDKRGTGLSDRVPESRLPTLEERMDDVRAVLEAVGSKRAVLCGVSEGGPMSALFAATYPEKTHALIMIGSYARRLRSEDYPWGTTIEERELFLSEIRAHWGGPIGIETRAPSMLSNPAFCQWWATYLRMSSSPGAAVALTRMNAEIDIRKVLPAIRVPTLVIHRTGDACLRVEEGRYLADRIPRARFVELPGSDHLPFAGDQDVIVLAIEAFLTGPRQPTESDRILTTVLRLEFDSADALSDARVVVREVEWFRGKVQQSAQGHYLATFDGPARAVRCALGIRSRMRRLRAGLHTGECEIAENAMIGGFAADMAEQVLSQAHWGQVIVSSTVKDLVAGSGLVFNSLALLHLGGESWRLFEVQ